MFNKKTFITIENYILERFVDNFFRVNIFSGQQSLTVNEAGCGVNDRVGKICLLGEISRVAKSKFFIILLILILFFSIRVFAIDGLITNINTGKNSITIDNNEYLLNEDTVIIRNGVASSLSLCRPLSKNNFQWGKLFFEEKRLKEILVEYNVIEGVIKKINRSKKSVIIENFRTPDTIQELVKYSFNNEYVDKEKLTELKKGQHVIITVGNNNILKIHN